MRASTLIILALLASTAVAAQQPAAAPEQTAPAASKPATPAPLPDKIRAEDDPSAQPAVTIRKQDNGDTVEEYRRNGQLYMVKVTPPNGIPYTLMDTNGDGRLDSSDAVGPVGPVYYTIYRWN